MACCFSMEMTTKESFVKPTCTCAANSTATCEVTAENVRNLAFIMAVLTVVGTGICARLHGWLSVSLSYDHPFFRLAALIALCGSAFWFGLFLWYVPVKRCQTYWWDYADEPDAKMKWEVVRLLTIGNEEYGPFSLASDAGQKPKTRGSTMLRLNFGLTVWAAYVTLFCLVAEGIHFLVSPHVPTIFAFRVSTTSTPDLANAAINLSGNLTAVLALIAAVISIYFTHKQLQAKVRADNRQAWIEKLRKLIADTIFLADKHASAGIWERKALWAKLNPIRLELELMLNPTERDHMLLVFFIQRMAFFNAKKRPKIEDADMLPAKIKAEYCCETRFHESWDEILNGSSMHMLVTYSMRLSHVVLKREWERGKATR